MTTRTLAKIFAVVTCCAGSTEIAAAEPPHQYVAGAVVQLNDNGAWSWFMDERVVVGSIRSVGKESETREDPDWGNLELSIYDMASGKVNNVLLHRHFEQDEPQCAGVPRAARQPTDGDLQQARRRAKGPHPVLRINRPSAMER